MTSRMPSVKTWHISCDLCLQVNAYYQIINDALFEAEMGNLNRQCFLHLPTISFPTYPSQKFQPLSSQVHNFQAREPFILQPPTQTILHKTQPSTQQELNFHHQPREPFILQPPTQAIATHTT